VSVCVDAVCVLIALVTLCVMVCVSVCAAGVLMVCVSACVDGVCVLIMCVAVCLCVLMVCLWSTNDSKSLKKLGWVEVYAHIQHTHDICAKYDPKSVECN